MKSPSFWNRRGWVFWGVVVAFVAAAGGGAVWWHFLRMPGSSYSGPLPPLGEEDRAAQRELERIVRHLAEQIGERNLKTYPQLEAAADFLEAEFQAAGYPRVERQEYEVEGLTSTNLSVEIPGGARPGEIVVVGAHYDTFAGTPGANDNASGVAAMLLLARDLVKSRPRRTLRFVAFTNEEPPYFQTPDMGSWVYARECRRKEEKIVAMLSLETLGYYTNKPNSQTLAPPFEYAYPSTGNFVALLGNVPSRRLVRQIIRSFRSHEPFPSEAVALPDHVPGVGWSDQWSFWQEGYPGVMVTDTAFLRYEHYHKPSDTPEKLRYDRLARVVRGLRRVLEDLAGVD